MYDVFVEIEIEKEKCDNECCNGLLVNAIPTRCFTPVEFLILARGLVSAV